MIATKLIRILSISTFNKGCLISSLQFTRKINCIYNIQLLFSFSTMQKDTQMYNSQQKQIVQQSELKQQKLQTDIYEDQEMGFDPQTIQQFVTKIKTKQKKPRCQKRLQKLQKLRADFKNPQLRKLQNQQRHRKQKQKLQKQLQGKTEQQKRQFLDKRKLQRNTLRQKMKSNLQACNGVSFLVDMCYQSKMNQKQIKSLASQIQLIIRAVKFVDNPPNVHLCGVAGKSKQQLQRMRYKFWNLKSNEEDVLQYIKKKQFQKKKIYYLSPDAPEELQEVNENCAFIIGGLVDRTVLKNASLNRAEELKVQARKLPIRQFMKQRSCLNLDHIVAIICKYQQTNNWKQAFDYGAPLRWKKESDKCQKNQQSEEETELKKEKVQQIQKQGQVLIENSKQQKQAFE